MRERRRQRACLKRLEAARAQIDDAGGNQPGRDAERTGAGQRVRRGECEDGNRRTSAMPSSRRERAQRCWQIALAPAKRGPNGTSTSSAMKIGANVMAKNGGPTEILVPVMASSASG